MSTPPNSSISNYLLLKKKLKIWSENHSTIDAERTQRDCIEDERGKM